MRKVAVLARIFDEYRESHEMKFHGRIKYQNIWDKTSEADRNVGNNISSLRTKSE